MSIITINVSEGACGNAAPLLLGYAGEDSVEAVDFDFSAWVTAYGEGEIYLEIMRAKDTAPYLAILAVDGTVARWTISDVDTAKHGPGVAQLVYQPTGVTKKSAIYKFFVGKSLTEPGGDDPWGPIIERMEEILAEVKEQAADADQSAQNAAGSAEDAEAWAVGERGGEPVPETDPTHENNAKYYADEAGETVRTFTETTAPAAVQAVNTEGQTQVQAVNTAGATKVQDVNTAGQTALTAVSGAQTAAVNAITQKSTEEQAAIQQKGEDVLESIPADYSDLSDEVSDLKSAIKISDGVETVPTYETGKFYDLNSSQTTVDILNPSNNSNLACAYIACIPGDMFYYAREYATSARSYGFLSSASDEGNIIYRSPDGSILDGNLITAPGGAKYAIFNWNKNYGHEIIKVSRKSRFDTVAQLKASYENLTAGMIVEVLGYNNSTDGLGCYYKISNEATEYAYTGRVSIGGGLYAIPLLNITNDNNKPNSPVTDIVKIAETYQQSGKNWFGMSGLSHTDYPTCFDSGFTPGTYNTSCSTLSRLIMYGITFNQSKYGGGNNEHMQGYMPDFTTQFAFSSSPIGSAAEQALYFAYKGLAYYPNSDLSNIRPGDLCFFSFNQDSNNAVFMSIDHVAIYLGPESLTADGKRQQHFIGGNGSPSDRTVRTFFYTSDDDYLSKVVLCAGFEKPLVRDYPTQIVIEPYTQHTVQPTTQGVFTYQLVKPFESLKAYTVVIVTDIPASSYTLSVGGDNNYRMTWDGVTQSYIRNDGSTYGIYHMLTPDLSSLSSDLHDKIRLFKSATEEALTVKEFKIYDGWI